MFGINFIRKFCIIILSLQLCACKLPDVITNTLPKHPETHKVRQGDTLYKIAKRYGVNYKELARINNIKPPFTINTGQRIKLKTNPQVQARAKRVVPVRSIVRASKKPNNSQAKITIAKKPVTTPAKTAPIIKRSLVKKPVVAPVKTAAKTPSKAIKKLEKPRTKNPKPQSNHIASSQMRWQWPVKGTITKRFVQGQTNARGIDVTTKLGSPVKSAEKGVVVYSGNGLRGYGNLIIIKHNRDFLSAYAHNKKNLVKEGQLVDKGVKIAEVGSTGTNKVKLHFEIRYKGQAVNPLKYLPKA